MRRSITVMTTVGLLAALVVPIVAGVAPAAADPPVVNLEDASKPATCMGTSSAGGDIAAVEVPRQSDQSGPTQSHVPVYTSFPYSGDTNVTISATAFYDEPPAGLLTAFMELGYINDNGVWAPVKDLTGNSGLSDSVVWWSDQPGSSTQSLTVPSLPARWYTLMVRADSSWSHPPYSFSATISIDKGSMRCPDDSGIANPASGVAADPVSAESGNFSHRIDMLTYPSFVYGMDLSAVYNSQDVGKSSLGFTTGWTSSLDVSLSFNNSGVMSFRGADGRRVQLGNISGDLYAAPPGMLGTAVFLPGDPNSFALQMRSGERWEFDADGHLVKKCQGQSDWDAAENSCADSDAGQVVTIGWSSNPEKLDHLTTVSSSLGGSTGAWVQTFTYTGHKVTSIRSHDDSNSATTNDRIVTISGTVSTSMWPDAISDPHYSTEQGFGYESYGTSSAFDGRIESVRRSIADSNQDYTSTGLVTLVSNTYDSEHRVATQTNESGDVVTFNWDYPAAGDLTLSSEATGEEVVYTHDADGRLVTIEDPATNVATTDWSQGTAASGDPLVEEVVGLVPTQTTNRLGVSTGRHVDTLGRVVHVATPDANGFLPTRYNDATFTQSPNPVLCQRLPDGSFPAPNTTTSFTRPNSQVVNMNCAGKRFGRAVYTYLSSTDPRVDTYTNAAGEITKYLYTGSAATPTKIMTGCVTYTSGTQSCSSGDAAVPSTSTTYEMSAANQVLSVTDGAGIKNCYHYDTVGRVDFETPRVSGTCPPTAQSTSTVYTYTALGKPATVNKPSPLGTWTYTYNGNGSLKSVADSVGSDSVTYTYTVTGETATVTDELGKVTTTTITRNITDQTECDGGVSGTGGYDIDNQPVETPCKKVVTTPPTGGPIGATTQYFDRAGNLRLTLTPAGGKHWNIYGTLSRLVKTVDASVASNPIVTLHTYDANGRLTDTQSGTETGTAGTDATASTAYDARGRVLTQTTAKNDASKVTTAFAYDILDRQIQQATAAPDGFLPSATYTDGTTCQRLPDGSFPKPKATTTYTKPDTSTGYMDCTAKDFGLRATSFGPTGATKQSVTYRSDGTWTAATEATVTPTYDSAGRQICTDTRVMAAQAGVTETHFYTATDYDSQTGLPTKTRTQLGSVTGCTDSPTDTSKWSIAATGYNEDGSVLWSQNPLQYAALADPQHTDHPKYRTTFGYDEAGRRTTVDSPDPAAPGTGVVTSRTCYSARGEAVLQIDPSHAVTKSVYTHQTGVVATVFDPTGMTYDSGTPCSSAEKTGSDLHRGEVNYAYDAAGRRITRSSYNDALSSQIVERWTYDGAGRLTGFWAPGRTYTPSDLNTATQAATYTIANGRLTHRAVRTGDQTDSADPSGGSKRVTTDAYLPSGALHTTTAVKYDTSNNPTLQTVSTRAYDPAGRVTSLHQEESHWQTSAWVEDLDQTLAYEYGSSGTLSKVTFPNSTTAEYQWDLMGNMIRTKTPSAAWFRQVYDEGQRLESVDVAYLTIWIDIADYTRNTLGQITNVDLGGTAGTRDYSYADATALSATFAETVGAITKSNTIARDANGEILEVCDATGTSGGLPSCQSSDDRTIYGYDTAHQLTSSTRKDSAGGATLSSTTHAYGNRGNRTSQAVYDGTNTTTTYYDSTDAGSICAETVGSETPTCTNTSGATVTYTNDAAGRRTTRVEGSTTKTFTYNPAGTLTKVANSGGATDSQTLTLDPAGMLYKVDNNSGADYDRFYWDYSLGLPQIMQWDANGLSATFAWGGDERTAITGSGTWYAYDHLHSHISTGGAIAPTGYTDYGKPTSTYSATVAYTYRAEATLKSGLVYLRNRYYDPTTGTFLTRDPIDSAGPTTQGNPYHYTGNDPTNRKDPTGLRMDDESIDLQLIESSSPCLPGTPTDPCPDREAGTTIHGDAAGGEKIQCGKALLAVWASYERDGCEAAQFWFFDAKGFFNVQGRNAGFWFSGVDACRAVGNLDSVTSTTCGGIRNAIRHFAFAAVLAYDSGRDGANYILSVHEDYGACLSSRTAECAHDSEVDTRNNEAGITYGLSLGDRFGRRPKAWEIVQAIKDLFGHWDEAGLAREVVNTATGKAGSGELDLSGGCEHSAQGNAEC